MSRIPIMIPEEVANLLGDTQEAIERAVLEILVLELYRRHAVSVGRAAKFLDLDQLAFIRWSGERGVPFFDMTDEDWEQERRAIESL
jgi:predicted HTH domain antitoxin